MKNKIFLLVIPLLLTGCGSNKPAIHKVTFDGGEYLTIEKTTCEHRTKYLTKISVKDEYLNNYEVPQNVAYYEVKCGNEEINNFRILSDENYNSVYLEIPKEKITGDISIKTEGYCHYLTFTGEDAGAQIYFASDRVSPTIKYCNNLKNQNWIDWTKGQGNAIKLEGNNKTIYVKNTNNEFDASFVTGDKNAPKISAHGNVMSLLNFGFKNYLASLFYECGSLISAPVLPAVKLSNSCYQQMFWGCSLTDAPILPATDLSNNCYQTMFCDCASLTTAPILPATTLANTCYERMFFNCTHLTVAPELPITTLTDDCYKDMFSGSGLIKAPKLPATTLMKGCYQQMFKACPDLVIPPQIPDTLTLPELSCVAMFKGCHKLQVNNIGKGTKFFTCPRDVLPESIADDMFEGTSGDFKGTPVAGESYYYTVD